MRESLAQVPTEGGEVFDGAEGTRLAREVADGCSGPSSSSPTESLAGQSTFSRWLLKAAETR